MLYILLYIVRHALLTKPFTIVILRIVPNAATLETLNAEHLSSPQHRSRRLRYPLRPSQDDRVQ